eukprot:scaffold40951_cov43-Phaeocystis_antarctica.AAC.3
MNLYAGNAAVDARFGLHHWPLFQIGAGNGPLGGPSSPDKGYSNVRSANPNPKPNPNPNSNPDSHLQSCPQPNPNPNPNPNQVRSDSLVRWMGYAAVAYGAKGLNW